MTKAARVDNNLNQPSPGLGRVPELTGIRALAVALVLLDHAGYLPRRFGAGPVGVTMFFGLSGFLITSVLLRRAGTEAPGLRNFYLARAVRLLPALMLMLAVMTPLAVIFGEKFGHVWPAAATGLFYVHNFYFARHAVTVFSPLWSLAVEEQFYLLWPLMLMLLLRWRAVGGYIVLAGAVASMILHIVVLHMTFANHELWADASLPTNCGGLLLGSWLALRTDICGRAAPRWLIPASLTAMAASMLSFSSVTFGSDYMTLAVAVMTVPLVWGLLHGNIVFRWTPVVFLGRISYSLYLWHWPLLWSLTFPTRGLAVVPREVSLAIAIVAATVSTLAVEEPIRHWWHRPHRSDVVSAARRPLPHLR